MSMPQVVELTCPECGTEDTQSVWNSVNVELNPELKQVVLAGNINVVRCQRCGTSSRVESNLLYHDPKCRVMFWVRDPEDNEDCGLDSVADLVGSGLPPEYRLRIVDSTDQLIEKIVIFDDFLDDRVVEVRKLLIADEFEKRGSPFRQLHYAGIKRSIWKLGRREMAFAFSSDEAVFVPWRAGYRELKRLLCPYLTSDESQRSWCRVDRRYASALWAQLRSDLEAPDKPCQPDLPSEPLAKPHYRVLVKDSRIGAVREEVWELSDEQARKFVQDDGSAYGMAYYDGGERRTSLVNRQFWDALPGADE